ncbi:MAG: CRISPR-associated helicase Cas3' [Corynebacterium sp.]|nr:CRISPR-associated helicase Cas3' [Corynebacterium sp.]
MSSQNGETAPQGTVSAAFMERMDTWLHTLSPQALSVWAKSGDETGWLSIGQHLADAASVAAVLWDEWVPATTKRHLSRKLDLSEGEVKRLLVFLAGTHDLGKCTITFTRQIENARAEDGWEYAYLVEQVGQAGLPLEKGFFESGLKHFPHGLASAIILRQWLKSLGYSPRFANSLAAIADAHHGKPSSKQLRKPDADEYLAIEDYPPQWKAVHQELIDGMAAATEISKVLSKLPHKGVRPPEAQLLAGLVVVADWISSNSDAFPFTPESITAGEATRVREGIDAVQLTQSWHPRALPDEIVDRYRTAFAWPKSLSPRPVQQIIAQVADSLNEPVLFIVEAPTGEGKTEAGLMAASILGAKHGAQGLFFAAPTMSTSNGLFNRTRHWAENSLEGGDVVSMYLAHSKNQHEEAFRNLKYHSRSFRNISDGGTVIATQWLSGSKKGVLSNIVVGTVDQVLLLALQMKHSMLRHIGLAGKVIIIDEVHSYDTYMSEYLERALEWLSWYGATVILMSATLPPAQREKLCRAYHRTAFTPDELTALKSKSYPQITTVTRSGVAVHPVQSRPSDATTQVAYIDDAVEALVDKLSSLLEAGGIALVICDTVRRAQDAYKALSESFHNVELHHSAFIASERSAKEERLRRILGPDSHRGGERPDQLIVVATQVAEQSLDIDADVLITDIAPMDLIIQRLGRVHRHTRPTADRPGNLQVARLFIRGIGGWTPAPTFSRGITHVYDEKILLATLACMPEAIVRPEDVPSLVSTTYNDSPDILEAWHDRWEKACEESARKRDIARQRADTFRIPSPNLAENLDDLFDRLISDKPTLGEEAGVAQVRDTEPTVEVIAIRGDDDGSYSVLPAGDGADDQITINDSMDGLDYRTALKLAASTVRIPSWVTRGNNFDTVITDLETQTPLAWRDEPLLKGKVALRFKSDGFAHAGECSFSYSPEFGLEVQRTNSHEPLSTNI